MNRLAPIALGLLALPLALPSTTLAVPPGVVVEDVAPRSSAAAAGLVPGDRLVSWRRAASPPGSPAPAFGEIRTVFDLLLVEDEEGPRGPVALRGERAGAPLDGALAVGKWGLVVRPPLSGDLLAAWERGREAFAKRDVDGLVAAWGEAGRLAGADATTATWIAYRTGEALCGRGRHKEGQEAYQRALDGARTAKDPSTEIQILLGSARFHVLTSAFPAAAARYAEAVALCEKTWGESLILARAVNSSAEVPWRQDDLPAAEPLRMRALGIRERLAPGSLELAGSLANMGLLRSDVGALAEAQAFHEKALTIQERVAPGSIDVAMTLNNLGIVAGERGLHHKAQVFYEKSLALKEQLVPGTPSLANTLGNLGLVLRRRGLYDQAEESLRRVLEIYERLVPGSLDVARALSNLGGVFELQGDLEQARAFSERALEMQRKVAPEGVGVATELLSLGDLALEEGNLERAGPFYRQALAITRAKVPNTSKNAETLARMGLFEQRSGNRAEARRLFEESLALREKLAGEGGEPTFGFCGVFDLAVLAREEGDLVRAARLQSRCLELRTSFAPGSYWVAVSHHEMGRIEKARGHLAAARSHYLDALSALDAQVRNLGGSEEAKSRYRSFFTDLTGEALELLVGMKREDEAFSVLERSRARSFLVLLARRDLDLGTDVPAPLEERRLLLAADYEKVQDQLAKLDATARPEEAALLERRLVELRGLQETLREEVREASPRVAALRDPVPLDVAGARATLETGELLLSYSVGETKTVLFALAPEGGLTTHVLPLGRAALTAKIETFRRLILRRRSGPVSAGPVLDAARGLGRDLLGPVAGRLSRARRVLVVPDGPLHVLPWGVLVRSKGRFLVEEKPLSVVSSATVLAELRKTRRDPLAGPGGFVAFGDPAYPAPDGPQPTDARVRAAVLRGSLSPLPATRAEVEGIRGAAKGVSAFLGSEATEERAKAIGRDARIVHFACHGILDERNPLDSALALAIPEKPGRDNGLLQAWEVLESIRLDADLVTLSACETALGVEERGEGIVGLTRAFQWAGARSVVASLWNVSDESTAELMKELYRRLAFGMPKDEALRLAQVSLVAKGGDAGHPFFWAAFELLGDSR
jgi:CHAT domain-containing protein/Tfp pilus assembly protein PilF